MSASVHIRMISGLVALSFVGAACSTSTPGSPRNAAAADHTAGHAAHARHETPDPGADDEGGDGMPGHDHHEELPPLASRLDAATSAERAAATDLLTRIRATLQPFESEPAARAAGFVPNPNGHRLIHYRNVRNRRDGRELDPGHPEGLVYVRTKTGAQRLLGAVFTVHAGEAAPTPGGAIFRWHTHDPSCPTFLVAPGACIDTFRMLHVWTTDAVHIVDPWSQHLRGAVG